MRPTAAKMIIKKEHVTFEAQFALTLCRIGAVAAATEAEASQIVSLIYDPKYKSSQLTSGGFRVNRRPNIKSLNHFLVVAGVESSSTLVSRKKQSQLDLYIFYSAIPVL
jgi:hypothetical protein